MRDIYSFCPFIGILFASASFVSLDTGFIDRSVVGNPSDLALDLHIDPRYWKGEQAETSLQGRGEY